MSAGKFRAELAARHASEARAQVLAEQLEQRQIEQEKILGDLAAQYRRNGEQAVLLQTMEREMGSRIQAYGETSSRLLEEKVLLEKQLASHSADREKCAANLELYLGVARARRKALSDFAAEINQFLPGNPEEIIQMSLKSNALQITLEEKMLFSPASLAVSAQGKEALRPLAEWLATHPEVKVEVKAHTDNQVPKALRTLVTDTWEWSQRRAAAVVRLFFRDFNLNPNQFTAVGAGEYFPLVSNETLEGRTKNRRIELTIYPKLPQWPDLTE